MWVFKPEKVKFCSFNYFTANVTTQIIEQQGSFIKAIDYIGIVEGTKRIRYWSINLNTGD